VHGPGMPGWRERLALLGPLFRARRKYGGGRVLTDTAAPFTIGGNPHSENSRDKVLLLSWIN
jgi:hypothetical protein